MKAGAIVLAGGESTRMGQDKGMMPWGDGTMIEHIVGALVQLGLDPVVAADNLPRFDYLGVPAVADAFPGPLGGLVAGLQGMTDSSCAYLCSCDSPCVDGVLIDALLSAVDGHDMAVPLFRGRLQPTHAVYKRSALSDINAFHSRGGTALKDLAGVLDANIVDAESIGLSEPGLAFLNINTPEQYHKATALFGQG